MTANEGVILNFKMAGVNVDFWIESIFELEDDLPSYYINFLQNDELLKFDDELRNMVSADKDDKDVQSNVASIGNDLRFSLEIEEGEEPTVKDHDDRIVPFKSLVNVESFGRCKISIEGLSVFDDYVKPIIKLKEIVLMYPY